MRRGAILAGLATFAVIAYAVFWRHHLKRFQVTREGVFYRSAQPTELGLSHLIRHHGIKTVVSLQLYDWRLAAGWYDPGEPDGASESEFVERLGARSVQWPMGEESYWPWLTPWQFEEFFKLLDDPDNWPVAVHCMGGRHRTGTLSALFRIEYDRWDVDDALAEMYSFDFGGGVDLHETNLRTYWPRPRPDSDQLAALTAHFGGVLSPVPQDYESLVRVLRSRRCERDVAAATASYLEAGAPFAIPLAARLIDTPDDPLVGAIIPLAGKTLDSLGATEADWFASAALVADFGDSTAQEALLESLRDRSWAEARRARFDQAVCGVTNRYTPNRLAFLRPLLECDMHHLARGARAIRYCDTAVARLSTILNVNLLHNAPSKGAAGWEWARNRGREWFVVHPEAEVPCKLLPATGRNVVYPGGQPPDGIVRGQFGPDAASMNR
jgi:hypothetical protein